MKVMVSVLTVFLYFSNTDEWYYSDITFKLMSKQKLEN